MAWSDKARKAAAEARRTHARTKVPLKQATLKGVFEGDLPAARKQFANALRSFRKTPGLAYAGMTRAASLKKLMTVVRASTTLRNAKRKGTFKASRPLTDGRGAFEAAVMASKRLDARLGSRGRGK